MEMTANMAAVSECLCASVLLCVCFHQLLWSYGALFYFFLWHWTKTTSPRTHTHSVYLFIMWPWRGRETPICQCADSSRPCTGYYDSIEERLSELVQAALSTAPSHWGRDDNTLLKYDTLPWQHAIYMPLYITGVLFPVEHKQIISLESGMLGHFQHVQWIRGNKGLHAWYWWMISRSQLEVLCQQCHLYSIFHA